MKFLRIFYLLIAVILFTPSCSRTNEQLLQAEKLIETAPDSAMAILQKYNYNSLADKDKALYGLVYVRIRDKKFLSLEPDSLLDFSIKHYNERHHENVRLATCFLYKGRKFKNSLQYEEAMHYYMLALDLLNNDANDYLKGHINLDLGAIYTIQRDYVKARKKFWLSYNQYINSGMHKIAFYCILYIGRTYNEEKKYDEALIFYKKHKITAKDSIEQGVLFQEIALNYYDKVQLDSAKHYLKKVLYYPYIRNNRAFRFALLADLYLDMRKIDSAKMYALDAFKYQPDIRTQKNCYRILTNIYSAKKNLDSINKYMSKYQDCNDSIRKIDSQTKGSYIETMHNTQKEVLKSQSWIWYLSILVLMVFALAILIYIRKHRKGLQTIKTIKEKQLVQKKESIQEVVERTKEALHQLLKEKRNELTKRIKQNSPEGRREMILQLYDELIHFKNKQHFRNEMDNTLNNLYSKLESGYPKLRTKEIQWACLNTLDIPNDDSMQLLDYNTEAFKKMKQRFAQKMGVESVANIDAVIKNMLYDET